MNSLRTFSAFARSSTGLIKAICADELSASSAYLRLASAQHQARVGRRRLPNRAWWTPGRARAARTGWRRLRTAAESAALLALVSELTVRQYYLFISMGTLFGIILADMALLFGVALGSMCLVGLLDAVIRQRWFEYWNIRVWRRRTARARHGHDSNSAVVGPALLRISFFIGLSVYLILLSQTMWPNVWPASFSSFSHAVGIARIFPILLFPIIVEYARTRYPRYDNRHLRRWLKRSDRHTTER